MHLTLLFTRTIFVLLSIFLITTYMVAGPSGYSFSHLIMGLFLGTGFGFALIGFDILFRRFNLRSFNIAVLGLFFGFFMGKALVIIFSAVLEISTSIYLAPQVIELIEIALFLFGIYLGILMTLKASDEIYVNIPFVKFSPTAQKKKDLILDHSILSDARVLDLALSGLVDYHLILPRFLLKELYVQAEAIDESLRNRARKSLEIVKKLEAVTDLNLRYNDTDFPEIKEVMSKLLRLARLLDANLLTADISRVQMSTIEGVKIINIHNLSNALKPLMQAGERIKIKIQRFGKEPRQGVGYLEDGTMVVVNGGGGFIGETIDVLVLSVKHTSSGRMIFCNAVDEEGGYLSGYDSHDEH